MRCGVMCHVILFKRRYASLSVRYTTRRAALLAVHNFGSLLNLLAANNKIIVLVASSFHAHAHVQPINTCGNSKVMQSRGHRELVYVHGYKESAHTCAFDDSLYALRRK